MASGKNSYTADFFKKDKKVSENEVTDDLAELGCSVSETSDDDGNEISCSEDDFDEKFNNEDMLISRLYREVVDEVMAKNTLGESTVDSAIKEMKQEIFQGHRKGFRRFRGINFNKPVNCCGYLRRYAVCHTGLVKKIMSNFFLGKNKTAISDAAKHEILKQESLTVVSLGGGPGNDLVGFCCALQEMPNSVKELNLYIVDVGKTWGSIFPTIVKKAISSSFGSFSECLKKTKINAGFMEADLTANGIFKNEDLSSILLKADLVLMIKLTSFLPDQEAGDLIDNVVNSMKPEAKLIFIDQPYDEDFFSKIDSLYFIYHDRLKYELSFKPARYRSPSIESTQAHVGIFEKKICDEDDSSENEQ